MTGPASRAEAGSPMPPRPAQAAKATTYQKSLLIPGHYIHLDAASHPAMSARADSEPTRDSRRFNRVSNWLLIGREWPGGLVASWPATDIKKIFIYRSGLQHWPFLQTGRKWPFGPPTCARERQGCRSGGKRELPRISAAKLEPLETALVVARLRSVGGAID
jgi:hypothetical protein